MAIAPLGESWRPEPATAPPLRLVRGGRPAGASARGAARHARTGVAPVATDRRELQRSRSDHPSSQRAEVLARPDVSTPNRAVGQRRSASRRRGVALTAVGAVAVVLLSLPLRSLAGVTVDGQVTPAASPGGLAPGSVYLVHAGDSVRSLASRMGGSGSLVANELRLERAIGSSVLVPGEHVHIP